MTPAQRDELLRRLRDPRNQFLFDPDVSKEAWKLLNDAADAIELLTRPEAQGETKPKAGAIDTPWPSTNVVKKLVEAADILLDRLDWDGDKWESIHHARDVARGWLVTYAAQEGVTKP